MVLLKRAYERPSPGDGYRVLVDRLWPRGVKREALRLDLWAKELAPSPALRVWFGHEPARFSEFSRRYRGELRGEAAQALLADLAGRARRGTVTLVYGARDPDHNGAVVLRDLLGEPRAAAPRAARDGRARGAGTAGGARARGARKPGSRELSGSRARPR